MIHNEDEVMVASTTQRLQPTDQTAWAYDDPKPRLFTDSERRAMSDSGILADNDRAKLLCGVIYVESKARNRIPRLFTRAEYHAMAEVGIIGYDERLQLIEGEIVVIAPAGNRHIAATILLTREFAVSGRLSDLADVSVQNPVDLTERSDPEPDFQLLKPREDGYAPATPRTDDVVLAVEVSDSTLSYDVDVKVPMYAAAGIPELWIMNLREDVIDSHTDPSPDGYRTTRRYRPGDTIAPLSFPDVEIEVSRLIPER